MVCEPNPLADAWQAYARGQTTVDKTPTATLAEQRRLKKAFEQGAVIEAMGKGTLFEGYTWGVTEEPRWDFNSNYYRIAPAAK